MKTSLYFSLVMSSQIKIWFWKFRDFFGVWLDWLNHKLFCKNSTCCPCKVLHNVIYHCWISTIKINVTELNLDKPLDRFLVACLGQILINLHDIQNCHNSVYHKSFFYCFCCLVTHDYKQFSHKTYVFFTHCHTFCTYGHLLKLVNKDSYKS